MSGRGTSSGTIADPTRQRDAGRDPTDAFGDDPVPARRIALLGNPNTGKTTLFNRLCGLRHKTSNFPGTTQEARIGACSFQSDNRSATGDKEGDIELVDLPGVYSLELEQGEADICRRVLAGELAPKGEVVRAPDGACVVLDGANLARNLLLAGEVLRRRLPTVVAVNMIDIARKRGVTIDVGALRDHLGCEVVLASARSGEGMEALHDAIHRAGIPNRTPPGTQEGLETWAEHAHRSATAARGGTMTDPRENAKASASSVTDRLDLLLTHPILGVGIFAIVMAGLFWSIFSLAKFPMTLLQAIFSGDSSLIASWQPAWLQAVISSGLKGAILAALPDGILQRFLADGVVSGIGATVVFLPQICVLFFLISLLEDTGYLARAAFVMNRALRPFGLPGHAFVPLLSSHACALPGIMACRGIPDPKERLATILVAPFMTCSARLPVYVLVTSILFPGKPLESALAFVGCYALGIAAGVFSALVARRTILKGKSRPMALELPTYKMPSLRTALITTYDRGLMFTKKAGTNILAICIVLWWLGAFPRVDAPAEAVRLRAQADASVVETAAAAQREQADHIESAHAKRESFIGHLGRAVEPVFRPLGFDWQLSIGILSSFAAREVFVSTMSVVVTGQETDDDQTILAAVAEAKRDDGITPVFDRPTSWALLVFYVLAMQCLPTLAVTARESGHIKWAVLQLVWMSGIAYIAAMIVHAAIAA